MNSIQSAHEILCRACQKTSDETNGMLNIYSKESNFPEFATISDLFCNYISLKIDQYKDISPFICIECYELITNFHKFRKMCVASHFDFLKRKHLIKRCSVQLENLVLPELELSIEIINSDDECINVTETEENNGIFTIDEMETDKNDCVFDVNAQTVPILVYPCPKCTQIFSTAKSLDLHLREHRIKDLTCLECGVVKKSSQQLNSHKFYKHNKERKQCEICCRTYYNLPFLRTHQRKVHHVVKAYGQFCCTLCKKQLNRVNDVREHEKTHTSNRNICIKPV